MARAGSHDDLASGDDLDVQLRGQSRSLVDRSYQLHQRRSALPLTGDGRRLANQIESIFGEKQLVAVTSEDSLIDESANGNVTSRSVGHRMQNR